MSAVTGGTVVPWFTIREDLSRSVTTGEVVDVSHISAVAFDVDVNITIGALQTPFALASGTPIGIDTATETISVDANAFMFAMGR